MGTPKNRVVSVIEAASDGNVHENAKNSVSDNQLLLTQLLEDKQTFVYKKLVVPMNMRSVYWKCYGFPANEDGEILTKVKIVCILCKTVISYNGNTSNLRMHLRSKHPQELDDLEAQAPPKKPRSEVKEKKNVKKQKSTAATVQYSMYSEDGTVIDKDVHIVSDPNITIEELSSPSTVKVLMKSESPTHNQNVTYLMQEGHHTPDELELHVQGDQSNFDRKTISDAIAEFIIMDLQLPDVVETGGFQRLVATLRSPCEIPSKIKLVEDVIPKLYDTFKDSIKENLSTVTGSIAIGIEEWMSDNSQSNVTITAHYQMPKCEEQLQSKVLLTYHCSELYDSELWCHTFDKLLVDWQIRADKVKAIVIATDQQLLLSALRLRGFVLIPCLVYTLQQVCMSCCFSLPIVSNVVNKVRMFLSLVYRNSNALTTLRIQEHVLQLDDAPLTLDYPRIWISTYIMLEQMLARRSIIKSVVEVIDASAYEKELINISDEDWSIIEDIVHVLEPFKVTLMTLAEEKSPLISLLKPLMWQLISVHLKVREDSDSDLSKQLKLALSQMLKEKYNEESVDTILKTATTLDPRFKQLPYAIEEGKTMLNGPIKVQLTALMEEKNVTSTTKDGDMKDTSKKTRLSGMEFLLGDLCTTSASLSINERADLEITQYQSEPMANLDHCPLTWWQKSTSKFPNLARLASSYNCIPATATPPSRIPVEPQVSYDMKRSKIFPEIMDKLLFLNANRQHYV